MKKPVRKSFAESRNWARNSPPAISCQSRTMVSENGTMKAALVERPAISHNASPAMILSQNGALRRRVFCTIVSCRCGSRWNRSGAGRQTGSRNPDGDMTYIRVPGRTRVRTPRKERCHFTIALASFQTLGSTSLS